MAFEVLLPIPDIAVAHIQLQHHQSIGNNIKLHTLQDGFPDLGEVELVIICLRENRRDPNHLGESLSFTEVRRAFYELFPGNWHTSIADLGDIAAGASVDDTYFAIQELNEVLIKKGVIPVFIGGSQDLLYPIYRSYDKLDQMVNLVNVDSRFDLGDASQKILNTSFVGKIIVEKPYNLFNYSNIGYQTYFNPQEEIDLMDKLYFDSYRLGNVSSDLSSVEPVMRDADVVGVDLNSIRSSELSVRHNKMPNGFDGKEICSIARYAGISDKVSSFGIFEYKNDPQEEKAAMLVAQMVWYFIEGVNFRASENLDVEKGSFTTYKVPIEDEVLTFYKSEKTDRWWIEIPFIVGLNNKLKRHTLLPSTYQDYLDACDQNIPERWFKARKKNEV
ncbi:formimidoylglutamase [Dokdonia sp. Hel_I_53]|uniref:formimidoylglutamase n=1 Tax=Dokdonia sp. Hel_I_53 TaxID=1566287 RepID=UPI001199A50B|nr:formimidoylglutamase [Dokdonia sp. Hel_I_53]TVZ52147.1 arginase family enzyme [Dokdonia sp. Hel_I_53]